MRLTSLFLLAALFCTAGAAGAEELTVVEGVVTTAVVDREPVDVIQTYPATVEKLYCFTELAGATEGTTITHVWYHGDQVASRSMLPVRGAAWRTWSVASIRSDRAGEWRVEVLDGEGNLLKKIPFTLTRR